MKPLPRVFLPLLCFGLFSPLTTAQQQAGVAQRDAAAVSAVVQCLTTMAVPVSPALQTAAQGILTDSAGQSSLITIETIGTSQLRYDIGTTSSFVSNSGNGFLILQGKRHTLAPWDVKYRRAENLPGLSLLADYQNSNLQIKYIGLENVNGASAHHVRLSMLPTDSTPPEMEDLMSETHVWIDQKTSFVVQIRTFDFSPETPQNRTPVDTLYGNYQQVSGALIPFNMTRYVAGQKDSAIVISSMSLAANNPLSDFQ